MRRVLFITGSVVFVDTVFFAALTPLVPHYADRFGLSKAGAGLLAAAYPVGVLAGSIPSGLLAARIGVRPASTLGLLLVA
ncbi:MAG TPA: MFS transporter, partial [Gaiellaceae bacterium]|nr:MFS transporter [Gaiellaceae bacterium]